MRVAALLPGKTPVPEGATPKGDEGGVNVDEGGGVPVPGVEGGGGVVPFPPLLLNTVHYIYKIPI